MAWEIKDESINLTTSRHVVVFHNKDILVLNEHEKMVPREHHLIHEFDLWSCPHCGKPKDPAMPEEPVDFEKIKADALATLNKHHKRVMQIRERSPKARIDTTVNKKL